MSLLGTCEVYNRPRKVRSSPSVRPQSMLPTAVGISEHQQALTAANLAFERASRGEMAKNNANNEDSDQMVNATGTVGDRLHLGRIHSVRFTGLTAPSIRKRSTTRQDASEHKIYLEFQNHPASSPLRASTNISTALPQPGKDFHETDVASVPSSYRKLRKAKSMFSPGKSPSAIFAHGTPRRKRHFQRHFKGHSVQSSGEHHDVVQTSDPPLRQSFLLDRATDRSSTSDRQYAVQDAAVKLARDQYLRQLEEQRLKEQPSFLNLAKRRRSHVKFRKTVRSNSTNSYGSAIASPLPLETIAQTTSFGPKVRRISYNLKNRIKLVFQRPPKEDEVLPVQQLNASHSHYGDYLSPSSGKEQSFSPISEPDAELLRRVGSRESITHTVSAITNKGSPESSIQIIDSDEKFFDDKSRVTSWTNSTATNTVNLPHMMERKRLSIIKEDAGPHQQSSSIQRPPSVSDGYATFRLPVRQNSAGLIDGPVDAQRVFSALRREIAGKNRRIGNDDSESGTVSGSDRSILTPQRTSSIRMPIPHGRDTVPGRRGKRLLDSSMLASSSNPLRDQREDVSIHKNITPQQFADLNESEQTETKRPLREVKSNFFPPSVGLERTSTSPYIRATHARSGDDGSFEDEIGIANGNQAVDPGVLTSSWPCNKSGTGSESVYSRTSNDRTSKDAGSSVSLANSENPSEAGPSIFTGVGTVKHEPSAVSLAHRTHSSTKSSADWKRRMVSETVYTEGYSLEQGQTRNGLAVKEKSGHRREKAQLSDEEVSIGSLPVGKLKPNQPLGILQSNANFQSSSKHSSSPSTVGRSHFMGSGVSLRVHHARQNENVPPIADSRDFADIHNDRLSPESFRYKPSRPFNVLRDQARLSNRLSPERAERVRRLKGGSPRSLIEKIGSQAQYIQEGSPDVGTR